ncbi:helicase ARIP4 isoform X5 [Lampetra fluviatilis]
MLALRTASLAGMEDESYSGSESNLDSEEEEEEEEESEEDEEEEEDDNTARDAAESDGDSAGAGEEKEAGGEGRPPKDPAASVVPSRKRADRAAALGTSRGTAIARKRQKSSTHSGHMRRNIRKLLRPEQLEADTLAAQLEELERRKRLEQTAYKPSQPDGSALEEVARESEVICVSSSEDDAPSHGDVIELSSEDEAVHVIGSESSGSSADEAGADDAEAAAAAASVAALGSHCNDARNQPDVAGRVLVNVNRPPDEPDIFMAPQLARVVKPHQIGGIRFLYDNLVESQERYSTTSGFGCILAHSMGLGKTLQLISFIDVLFRHTDARTVLAIVPVNTLQNWLAEFNHWLPPAGHGGTGQGGTGQATGNPGDATEEAQLRTFPVHILNDDHKTTVARARVIAEWSAGGGVLLMGYEMFRLLSLKKASLGSGRKKKPKKEVGPVIIDLDEEDRQQELLLDVEKALTRPGADVVICDEGHRIKNCHASTAQALKAVRTRRRVVLTGYPLQNNLIEYWCMVDFVRPNFLGTRQEFSNLFERPILNGQCVDSTPQDMRLMRYRSHVLHSLLEGFVQRRGHNVLTATLPAKEEHVLLVRLSPIQRALYRHFMLRFQEAGSSGWLGSNPLKAYCVCCKIWNHPDILFDALQKESIAADPDLDLEVSDLPAGLTRERGATGSSSGRRKVAKREVADLELPNGRCGAATQSGPERGGQVVTYEWAKDLMGSYQTGVLEHSAKMVLLFHLVEESVRHGDKILVFSQSLSTLDIIEAFLSQRKIPTVSGSASPSAPSAPSDPSASSASSASSAPPAETQVPPATSSPTGLVWSKNVNYYRLDGSTATSEREKLINQFNNPLNSSVWLFLLSTRAGCLGINLIGANRVVIFDASWNPCHDAQAVCRVFRYGQVKPCFVYRLVSDFTLEKKIYDRQISKQGMSNRVVDDMNPVLNFTRHEVENLLHLVEEEDAAPVDLPSIAQRHHDPLLRNACLQHSRLLTKALNARGPQEPPRGQRAAHADDARAHAAPHGARWVRPRPGRPQPRRAYNELPAARRRQRAEDRHDHRSLHPHQRRQDLRRQVRTQTARTHRPWRRGRANAALFLTAVGRRRVCAGLDGRADALWTRLPRAPGCPRAHPHSAALARRWRWRRRRAGLRGERAAGQAWGRRPGGAPAQGRRAQHGAQRMRGEGEARRGGGGTDTQRPGSLPTRALVGHVGAPRAAGRGAARPAGTPAVCGAHALPLPAGVRRPPPLQRGGRILPAAIDEPRGGGRGIARVLAAGRPAARLALLVLDARADPAEGPRPPRARPPALADAAGAVAAAGDGSVVPAWPRGRLPRAGTTAAPGGPPPGRGAGGGRADCHQLRRQRLTRPRRCGRNDGGGGRGVDGDVHPPTPARAHRAPVVGSGQWSCFLTTDL